MGQANTAGHTKKNLQYAIFYIGYAVGKINIAIRYSRFSLLTLIRESNRPPNLPR